MKNQKSKSGYFNSDHFVHLVLSDTKMLNAEPEVVDQLSAEIERLLNERIISTVVSEFKDKELFLLEKMMADHPELDEVDVISILAENLPGLNDLIVKTVNDLYEELVGDVKSIDKKAI
ncbi:MAG: hypothetical protein ACRCZE_02925 [Candidatus Altimarinota bacterium]